VIWGLFPGFAGDAELGERGAAPWHGYNLKLVIPSA
jgi:hypothetical protein